jgi:hypothetical protein
MATRSKIVIRNIPTPPKEKCGEITFDKPHKREAHEIKTAKRLIQFGDNILFLKPSKIKGEHTPDIEWRKAKWKMKRPSCNNKENVVRAIKDARKQSDNITRNLL